MINVRSQQALSAALTAENISYIQWLVIASIHEAETAPSLAGLAINLGYSYHALHKMVERTFYFEKFHDDVARLRLNGDGLEKLHRMQCRLERAQRPQPEGAEP